LTVKGEETGEVGKKTEKSLGFDTKFDTELGQGLIVADQPFSFFHHSVKMCSNSVLRAIARIC